MEFQKDIVQRIQSRFLPKGKLRGGILFLPPEEAIELIRAYETNGIPILGIDAFIIGEGSTQPDMTNSIDFSTMRGIDCWKLAAQFVEDRKCSGLSFEVVA